jgi:hypothetical protein
MTSNAILQLMPDFLSGCRNLYLNLEAVVFVLAVFGFTLLCVRAFRENSVSGIYSGLVSLTIASLTVMLLPSWCDTVTDGVSDLIHLCGWNQDIGGVFQAYNQAIATKFGTANLGGSVQAGGNGGTPQTASGVHITHYGYSGDPNGDGNSRQGVGAFPFDSAPGSLNNIGALRAAALSPDVANAYNVQPGQQFNVQVAGGQTMTLVYADKTDPSLTGRIDLFDPQDQIGALDGASVTNIAGNPITVQQGFNILDPIGSTWALIQRAAVWLLSVLALVIMAGMVFLQQMAIQIEIALSPIFIGFALIPALRGVATRFFTNLASLLLWPLGWIIVALINQGLLDLALASSTQDNVGTGIWYAVGSPIAWIMVAVMTIAGSFLAPFFISRILTASATAMLPLVAAAWARTGGAALAPVAPGMNGAVKSTVNQNVRSALMPTINYAKRP